MDRAIASVRGFNRFFTKLVGALDARFLGTDMSLAEARLLFEVAHAKAPLASDLQATLDMDAGYVSRVLRRFETRGWIDRSRGEGDARRRPITLTVAGRAAFDELDVRQRDEVTAMLDRIAPAQRRDLVAALGSATLLLDPAPTEKRGFTLRPFRTGDLGMIVARQSVLYREVYGWGPEIEAVECETALSFLRDFKPGREQCWIAEVEGVMAGSVILTDEGEGLCRLRLLYVEPFARGLGIGDVLVGTCLSFARSLGYRAMTLWTHTVLESARRIYAGHGFEMMDRHVHEMFGPEIQSETWRIDLTTVETGTGG